ncbi:ScbR family autoregulator-binding transcription factor [Streptomyces californicus]|uniref:ScbR family autoregulator-binding transcription factor n=1 Tax=Streptomyces TaxID=1883 RepID=UPI000BF09260|nr:ScbR family autoregulator-binding transcription factor [Streptomyces sp. sk226]
MAKQARAVQTWRSIVDAAASVFDDYGYERAAISEILRRAKVTKGALYFHFASKEAIAQAIMDEQTSTVEFEQEGSPLQSLVDGGQQFAFALRHNAMARAGTRLSIEGVFLGGPHPWGDWIDATARMLELGQERGEVFPQIDPMVSAKIIVASFTGIQLVSEADTGRADLREQVAEMWRHILPSIAHPGVIAHIKPEGRVDLAAQAREEAAREARGASDAEGSGSAAGSEAGAPTGGAGLRSDGSDRAARTGRESDEGDTEPAAAGIATGGAA